MDLGSIFLKFKRNLKFFHIEEADISPRNRVLVEEALEDLDRDESELEEDFLINISALRCRSWEMLHIGKWSDVGLGEKYLYSLATYLEVLAEMKEYLLCNSAAPISKSRTCVEHLVESLDMGILLGEAVKDELENNIFCSGASDLSQLLSTIVDIEGDVPPPKLVIGELYPHLPVSTDIPVVNNSLAKETFTAEFYTKGSPVLIEDSIKSWPAIEKWRDLSYFQKNFGSRSVPIEIGSQYTTDDWGQEMVLFKDFIAAQFGETRAGPIQYLAQHDLFHQIPELKADIHLPDLLKRLDVDTDCLDTKIWMGPGGTISPLHFDRKENFLCQVLGWKKVLLISPEDSAFLYPYEGEMLSNTSQLDFSTAIDETAFPLAAKAKRLNVMLGPGQMLFIPFGWWHFVTSLTPSISVSFWWTRTQ